MDLLGSILGSMDKPPATKTSDAEKKRLKERREQMDKWKQQENKRISLFKATIRKKAEEFIRNPQADKLKFEPMNSVDRALLREICDDAGLTAFSFGEEEVDRHVIVWKKESAPGDDELSVLRRGEEWCEEKAQLIKRKREAMEYDRGRKISKCGPAPKSDYHTKYNHIISLDVGKHGAQDISANKQYGNVKLENKQDKRTIEETLAERRQKKITPMHSGEEKITLIPDSGKKINPTHGGEDIYTTRCEQSVTDTDHNTNSTTECIKNAPSTHQCTSNTPS